MRCVYICSAIRGNIPENTSKLHAYAEYVVRNGKAPVLPFLRGKDCNPLIFASDEVWVFGDYLNDEMIREIKIEKSINLKVKYIKDSEVFKVE